MGDLTLNDKQQRRARILERVTANSLTVTEAAFLLKLSARQVRTLKKRYSSDGMAACIHGNRGRPPSNKLDASIMEKLVGLAGPDGKYKDYNTCHLCEVLQRDYEIVIARATLDRLLVAGGLRKRKRPGEKVVRKRRKRRSSEGAMLQIDGSLHPWLGKERPSFCLLGAIDDATGKISGLLFRPTEDQAGYLTLLRQIAVAHGLPESIYHDKHTILRSPKEPTLEDELAGRLPRSQVGRVLDWLGVESISAHSPQAKGRVERLWGTLQDRLSKELATKGVVTIEEANEFLPGFIERFNATFAKEAAQAATSWVALDPSMDLDYYFSAMKLRTVRPDNTVSNDGKTLQLLPEKRGCSLPGQQVQVHQLPDASLLVYHSRKRIQFKALAAPPPRAAATPGPEPVRSVDPEKQKAGRRKQMAYLHTGAA
jgi:transposase